MSNSAVACRGRRSLGTYGRAFFGKGRGSTSAYISTAEKAEKQPAQPHELHLAASVWGALSVPAKKRGSPPGVRRRRRKKSEPRAYPTPNLESCPKF